MPLTTTRASASPMPRVQRVARSASVSLTGISSGCATAMTPVRAGSASIAWIVRPWRAIGPTRAASANVRGALEHRDAVAGGRRVERRPGRRARRPACGGPPGRAPRPCRCVSSSRMPGVAAAKYAEHPRLRRASRPAARGADRAGTPRARPRGRSRCGAGPARSRARRRQRRSSASPWSPAERARDVVARGHLGDDRAQPAPRGDEPERGGDRRLADAALAGDDEQLLGGHSQASPSQ